MSIVFNNLSHGHRKAIFNHNNFAPGNQTVVDINIDGLADFGVQFNERPDTQFHKFVYLHNHTAQDNNDLDGDVIKILKVFGAGGEIWYTLDTYSHVLPGMQEDAAQKIDTSLRIAIQNNDED